MLDRVVVREVQLGHGVQVEAVRQLASQETRSARKCLHRFVAALAPGENLTSTFRRVLEQFRASYVLYFTPTGVDRQGPHTLDVRVKRAGTEVRARRGYVYR